MGVTLSKLAVHLTKLAVVNARATTVGFGFPLLLSQEAMALMRSSSHARVIVGVDAARSTVRRAEIFRLVRLFVRMPGEARRALMAVAEQLARRRPSPAPLLRLVRSIGTRASD